MTKRLLLGCLSNNSGAAKSSCTVGLESWQGASLTFQSGIHVFTHRDSVTPASTVPRAMNFHSKLDMTKILKTFNLTALFGCI